VEFGPTHIFTQIYAPDNEEGMGQTDKQTDGLPHCSMPLIGGALWEANNTETYGAYNAFK